MARRTRLPYLGPAIVLVGAAIAGALIWYMVSARPVPGEVIDAIAMDAKRSIVLREEASGDRSFIELRNGKDVVWRAHIPQYAGAPGRPAVAWSDKAITVRVARNQRAEVFAFAMQNAQRLGLYRLAQEHEPIRMHPRGPITLTDHERSYEVVGGDGWNQLIAIDLVNGGGIWKVDLGPGTITSGGVEPGRVWLHQAGKRRVFEAATGGETPDLKPLN